MQARFDSRGPLDKRKQERDEKRCIEEIVATHAAYLDAIERVLGAPPHSHEMRNELEASER